jgi:hypothetical protein
MVRFTKSWGFGSKTSNGYYTLLSVTVFPQEGKVEEVWDFIDYSGGVGDPPADRAGPSVSSGSRGPKDAAAEPKSKGKPEKQKPKAQKVKTEKKPSSKAKAQKKGKS